MAETLVENKICKACGAEVRVGALFCYSCGKSVQTASSADLKEKKNVSNAWFREDLTKTEENGNQTARKEQAKSPEIIETPIAKPSDIEAAAAAEDGKLKSAAAMRRKSKIYQPKKIEILWEEHDNPPNGWFIAAAIALTLLAAGILYLAMYLK